jgi:beta-lactamase class A
VSAEARVRAAFARAGVAGSLHAMDVDRPAREVAVDADAPVVLASVFKVALLLELLRRGADAELDLTEQVTVGERTRGPIGLAAMRDEARLSLRDLAYLMIAVSDVGASDVLYDRIGPEAVNALLDRLGLHRTRIVGASRDLVEQLLEDAGASDAAELAERLRDPALVGRLRSLDPARTNRGTARELTALLALIWRDEAAAPAACAEARRLLGLQVWPHRLASGFPHDEIRVSGKTGTLPTIRNEVGVIEFPDGARFAVAVFTRTPNPAATLPHLDALIGRTARIAVDALRTETD